MFTTTEENEVALSLFCDFGIFSQYQFCLFCQFCFRVLSCSVPVSEACGGWCSCSTIRPTSGLVTLIEASYSEDEVTTGSVNPWPPRCTRRPRRSLSKLVTLWSVTAGLRTTLIACSSGLSTSAISGMFLGNMSNGAADQK